MNGWSSHAGADRWDDEPGWVYEITWEWEPLAGQRYPGDEGRRRAVHTPVYEPSRPAEGDDDRGFGRASVGPPPAQPPSWSQPPEDTQGIPRAQPAPRAGREEPSWNRPVPLPERLPEARPTRPGSGGPPQYDQRTPFRDDQMNLQDALASYYGPRMPPPSPNDERRQRPPQQQPPQQRDGRAGQPGYSGPRPTTAPPQQQHPGPQQHAGGPAPQQRDGSGRPQYRDARQAPPEGPPRRDPRQAPLERDSRQAPLERDHRQAPLEAEARHDSRQAPLEGDARRDPRQAPLEGDTRRDPRQAPLEGDARRDPRQAPLEGDTRRDPRQAPLDGPSRRDARPPAPHRDDPRGGYPGDARSGPTARDGWAGPDVPRPRTGPPPGHQTGPRDAAYPSSAAPYSPPGYQQPREGQDPYPRSPEGRRPGPDARPYPGSPAPHQGGRSDRPMSPAPYQSGRPQESGYPPLPQRQSARPHDQAPAAYPAPRSVPPEMPQRPTASQPPPVQGRRLDTPHPYADAPPEMPHRPTASQPPQGRRIDSLPPYADRPAPGTTTGSRHDTRPGSEGYYEARPQSPAPQYDGRRRALSDTTPPYRPLPQVRPGQGQPEVTGPPRPDLPPVAMPTVPMPRPASAPPTRPAQPPAAPTPSRPPVAPPPQPTQPPAAAPPTTPQPSRPPVATPRQPTQPPAAAPPQPTHPSVVAPRSAPPVRPAPPLPPVVAPRSAMPAPPSIVSQQPMPPIVAEPPSPTRLTPSTGPGAHYLPAPPASPYEPQPRHAPHPQQDGPIRPELPPDRQVRQPRDEPGERTDDLHLEHRRDLSATPVEAPPTPRYGYVPEPTPPPEPLAEPAVAPISAAPISAAPISATPVSPSSWFDAPVSAPPAAEEDAVATTEVTTAEEADPGTPPEPEEEGGDHGLGWLLSLSGLGANTVDPEELPEADTGEAGPVSSQPVVVEPISAPPAVDEPDPARTDAATPAEAVETGRADDEPETVEPAAPEGEAGEGVDWFAPATDPQLQIPVADDTGEAPAVPQLPIPVADDTGETPAIEDAPAAEVAPAAPADTEFARAWAAAAARFLATESSAADPAPAEPEPEPEPATESEPELEPVVTEPAPPAEETTAPVAAAVSVADIEEDEPEEDEEPEEPERRLVDPEQVLAAYDWRFDPETLREKADNPDELRAIRDRLTDKLEYAERHAVRARLLSLRAVVSRVLGEHARAVADGRKALKHAQATGELRRISITRARLAHALQWRGDYAAADRMFEEADSAELPDRLRAEISELAGRSAFEQGRHLEAVNHFERALDIRRDDDPEQIARIEVALDAVQGKIHTREDWGPYPRSREEILQLPPVLHPTLGFDSRLWGYADREGELVIPERYADARPFHDGVAWVLRPRGRAWELIDAEGTVLVDESAGYVAVGPFTEGLAWVSREATGGWFAIDRQNRVVVAGGFDDVRAFHSGLAPVRRVGWGAVDQYGRLVVQPKFLGFATSLTTGRHLDGFTDEGLAILDAGDVKGVVDRTGRLIVPPVHSALLIHPVAFVIGDRDGRWGALDRDGAPLIDMIHANHTEVLDELDRLLADTRPVL